MGAGKGDRAAHEALQKLAGHGHGGQVQQESSIFSDGQEDLYDGCDTVCETEVCVFILH